MSHTHIACEWPARAFVSSLSFRRRVISHAAPAAASLWPPVISRRAGPPPPVPPHPRARRVRVLQTKTSPREPSPWSGEALRRRGRRPKPSENVEASWIKISELTNETITVEWSSSAAGSLFSAVLENSDKSESQNKEATADDSKKCSVEFTGLKPLTKYIVKITSSVKGESSSTVNTMTPPSLEMPEIEDVTFKSAHLTLAPLPEEQAKDVEGYLLLVRPLEDAKDYPKAEIKDASFKSKLESLVEAPFYIAYEFTQEELSEETGGQVQVGSGAAKKDGKYGAVQDPKLTSGGNYRVVLVVIMNVEGERTLFAEESCQMLVK